MFEFIVFSLVVLGGLLASRYLSSRGDKSKIEAETIEGPTANEGIPVPVLFGVKDIDNPNCVWYGDVLTTAVKKDGQTVNYKYYVGLHLILCMGHIDRLHRLIIDNETVFDNATGQLDDYFDRYNLSDRTLDYENIFGGQYDGGGFKGIIDLEKGLPTQTVNDYLNTALDANGDLPAFRGVSALVARQTYVGTSSYLKPWKVRAERIMKRFDGTEQWYPDYAIINTAQALTVVSPDDTFQYKVITDPQMADPPVPDPLYAPGWTPYRFDYYMSLWDDTQGYIDFYMPTFFDAWTAEDMLSGQGAFGHSYTGEYDIETDWPIKRAIWIKKTFESTGKYDITVTGYIKDKCWIMLDNTKLVLNACTTLNFGFTISANDIPAGEHFLTILALNQYEDEFPPGPSDTSYFAIKLERESSHSMNPAHIIREVLTDPDWGMGFLESKINDSSFKTAAQKFYNENFGLCLLWDRQSSADSFIKKILEHVNANLYLNPFDGKFTLEAIRDNYIVTATQHVREQWIKSITGFKKQSVAELVNEVVLTYDDIDLGTESTISIQDSGLVRKQGGVISKSISYEGIVSAEVANKVCRRDLTVLSNDLSTFSILCAKELVEDFTIGHVFRVSFPDYLISEMVVRVVGITFPDGTNDTVKVDVMRDVSSLQDDGLYIEGGLETTVPPLPKIITLYAIFETPYWIARRKKGSYILDSLLTDNSGLAYMTVGAARPSSNSISADVYNDKGSGYSFFEKIDFCPKAQLSADINQIQTTISIKNEDSVSDLTLGTLLQIGSEFMVLMSYSAGQITVKRGVLDTVVEKHFTNDYIIFFGDYITDNYTEYDESQTIDTKLLTRTSNNVLGLSDVNEIETELDSRMIRPYPPGNIKINSEYFPTNVDISRTINLTWNHRLRTSGGVEGFTDGTIGPESGTQYKVFVYDVADLVTPVYESDYISGESHSFSGDELTGHEDCVMQFASYRDGFESFYRQHCEFSTTPQEIWVNTMTGYDDILENSMTGYDEIIVNIKED